ncbi:unnamed protein product [Camellia sinensis]
MLVKYLFVIVFITKKKKKIFVIVVIVFIYRFDTFIYRLCPNYFYPWETKRASEGWYQLFQSFSAASGEVNVASDLKKCCILLKTKRSDQVLRIDFQKVIKHEGRILTEIIQSFGAQHHRET